MPYFKQRNGVRSRLLCLRFESLETRTLMSVTPIQTIPENVLLDESSTEIVATEVPTDSTVSQLTDAALSQLEERVGTLTLEEQQMLIGEEPVASADSEYGGDPSGIDSYGSDPYGGDPYGGDPYGGDPYGGDPYGGNSAPTTIGINDITVDEDSDYIQLDLSNYFYDAEDGNDLTFSVVENTNDSVVDAYGGGSTLDLTFVPDAFGSANITIRATDSGGLSIDTTFTVNVNPVNDAPTITSFSCYSTSGDWWVFYGTVSDVDDDVEGMLIDFGDVLAEYSLSATVQSDGTFQINAQLPDLQTGVASAQTMDGSNALSNIAICGVFVL